MAELTDRIKIPFPAEFDGDWFFIFKEFANSIDFSLFSTLTDRNLVIFGGGTFQVSSGGVSWSNDLFIKPFSISLLYRIQGRTVLLNDGDGLFAILDRSNPLPGESIRDADVQVRNYIKLSPGLKLDSFVLICARFGDKLVFRNGRVLELDMSAAVFEEALVGGAVGLNFIDDNLTPQVNGTNTLFTTALPFEVPNISLYLNGIRLVVNEDFTIVNDHQVQTVLPVPLGNKLVATYLAIGTKIGDLVWDENLTAQVNGVTDIFTVTHKIRIPNLSVFHNGVKLVLFDDFNFVVGQPKKFQLNFVPIVPDKLVVQYMRQL